MSKRIPLIAGIALVFAAGVVARGHIGFEYSPDSIRLWVQSLSWQGPILYVVLVVFRQFLLLPSAILLPVGGLCFGALAGTGLGALGILLSGVMKYVIAWHVGHDAIEVWLGERFRHLRGRLDRGGPLAVGLITAHPMGPMAWCHWGAGLSSIPLSAFVIAVATGAVLRSAAYALLGSTLLTAGSLQFYFASALLLVTIVLPLAHPAFRRRLLGASPPSLHPDIAQG